jgi:hypothetical protein
VSDYQAVQNALERGASPAMLCETCPWDRNCISPPSMTAGDVEARVAEAAEADRQRAEMAAIRGGESMPTGTLLTALFLGGRDTQAQVCPVFALRLRSSAGRRLADSVRSAMQSWDDES